MSRVMAGEWPTPVIQRPPRGRNARLDGLSKQGPTCHGRVSVPRPPWSLGQDFCPTLQTQEQADPPAEPSLGPSRGRGETEPRPGRQSAPPPARRQGARGPRAYLWACPAGSARKRQRVSQRPRGGPPTRCACFPSRLSRPSHPLALGPEMWEVGVSPRPGLLVPHHSRAPLPTSSVVVFPAQRPSSGCSLSLT